MKHDDLAWLVIVAMIVVILAPGCAAPALKRHPLTWEKLQSLGEISIEAPSWKGDSLRLPIRVRATNGGFVPALHFQSVVSDNLICITASRDLSDKAPADVYEVLIDLPKQRLQEYL